MRDDARMVEPYEAPSIAERTPIARPLIGLASGTPSAAFRAVPAGPYEVPRVESRHPIDDPLIGGPGTGSASLSAAFRSVPAVPYTAPRIVARDPLDLPLIGAAVASVVVCASFHSQ
jgi:hypothetical protein